uniref:NADH-ubiquinone oxidoreductase chain 2 n=1 Tax=Leptocorisa costalis TaxID=2899124 RepID=A0A8T9EH30_9HEMI|nr:NADH dehydrogenase subunit 2 [Leptocorisa costalis]UNA68824.1 NADH dehydrogenase subunit 2 [Leptocorisa costalis]
MIMNSSKIIFIFVLMMSTLMTISANNWLGMWMGMEMNLMAFIPLISKSKNKNSSQAMMMYFLVQSIGSVTLLFSVTMNPLVMANLNFEELWLKEMIMVSLAIKLGAAPFHWWLPNVMSNLNWPECLILMTWQKLAPLTVMNNLMSSPMMITYMLITFSGMVGSFGGLNQTSVRKMLGYSSINHLGWMMSFMSMSDMWYKYLIIYSLLMSMICYMLNHKNIYFLNQMMPSSNSMTEKFMLTIMMLSIGGLPPFIGFLPKWMAIQSMISSSLVPVMITMLVLSLVTLLYYLRMMINYMLMYSTMNKWMKFKSTNLCLLYITISVNMLLPTFLTLNFF